jgi:hypothetical protein
MYVAEQGGVRFFCCHIVGTTRALLNAGV